MLDAVPAESLLNLLSSVQTYSNIFQLLVSALSSLFSPASPPGPTNIPSLDSFLTPGHSSPSPSKSSVCRGDVIELQGPPGSGKTHFLYVLIVNCILPYSFNSITLGGWGKVAFVLDMDRAFDIRRFNHILCAQLMGLLGVSEKSEVATLSRECIKLLHVFHPGSSLQLASTIFHIPKYLALHFPQNELGLVSIDSVSTFYWSDRFKTEQLRAAYSRPSPSSPLQYVTEALQSLRIALRPVIAISNWGLLPSSHQLIPSSDVVIYKQHLTPFPIFSTKPIRDSIQASISDGTANLPVMYHVTFSLVRGLPTLAGAENISAKPSASEQDRMSFKCIVRACGNDIVKSFSLHIKEDGVYMK